VTLSLTSLGELKARRPLDEDPPVLSTGIHEVIDLMMMRHQSRSVPKERTDNAILSLVIEGGGMRGIVSGGMLVALEHLRLTNVFDRIYGASAGAINAAYFIANQAAYGATAYYQDLTDRRFINFGHVFTDSPVVSLTYLIDDVMVKRKPLDWRAVVCSKIDLHVIATSLSSDEAIETVDLGPLRDEEHLRRALHASARMPVLTGEPVEVNGHRCLDSSLYLGIPFVEAVKDGATHILVLLSRPAGVMRGVSLLERIFVARRLRRTYPRLARAMEERVTRYRDLVARLAVATTDPTQSELEVPAYAVQVRSVSVRPFEQNPHKLIAGAIAGMVAIFRLTGVNPQVLPVLQAFD
jgi:predicted patatin/cPLA2 family phospholipase